MGHSSFGHPIHKDGDPRVPALRSVAQANGFYGKGWRLADALIARRESRISAATLAGCGLTAIVWAGCAGIVLLWLAGAVPGSLGSG